MSVMQEEFVYCDHLEASSQDMKRRFADLLSLAVSQWTINTFKCDVTLVNSNLQEQQIDEICHLNITFSIYRATAEF